VGSSERAICETSHRLELSPLGLPFTSLSPHFNKTRLLQSLTSSPRGAFSLKILLLCAPAAQGSRRIIILSFGPLSRHSIGEKARGEADQDASLHKGGSTGS